LNIIVVLLAECASSLQYNNESGNNFGMRMVTLISILRWIRVFLRGSNIQLLHSPFTQTSLHVLPTFIYRPARYVKVKIIPQQIEVGQGVPGRLRPRIFLTFGTKRVIGRQPYAPAAFTQRGIPVTHFQSTPGHMVPSGATEKIPSDTTRNRSRDLPNSSALP